MPDCLPLRHRLCAPSIPTQSPEIKSARHHYPYFSKSSFQTSSPLNKVLSSGGGIQSFLRSRDIQVSEATAAVWFFMAELLQLAKPRVWTPLGSTWSKGRDLQIHLALQHDGGASARGQKSEPRQLEEKIWKLT